MNTITGTKHVWECVEIELEARNEYRNPYAQVECWVDLEGPGFAKRVYGFWDGGSRFRIRVVATAAGRWRWTSGANVSDPGLCGESGSFEAIDWAEADLADHPNRRGFIKDGPEGHTLTFADGTPFFLVGDTWWTLGTHRFPWEKAASAQDVTFKEAVEFRRRQGYNAFAAIASFPNWHNDGKARLTDSRGIVVRAAWEDFTVRDDEGEYGCKDMTDEDGNRPFAMTTLEDGLPCADFDRINPAYFRNLDRKAEYLHENGFVLLLESIRRDHGPSWKAYFDFDDGFPRYLNYLYARYGAWNVIFSAIHLDYVVPGQSLSGPEWNRVINLHYRRYGPPPFGNLVTAVSDLSSLDQFGHGRSCPWLSFHGVGNSMRNHMISYYMEELFRLPNPLPALNQEPYYPGWPIRGGRAPLAESDSDEDHYFARANAWGSVLSGGYAGHVYGTGAYDGSLVNEAVVNRMRTVEVLRFPSSLQIGYLAAFVNSEIRRLKELEPAPWAVFPRKAPFCDELGLYGWVACSRTKDRSLCLLYFERQALPVSIHDLPAASAVILHWFDTSLGLWLEPIHARTDEQGTLPISGFPDSKSVATSDWALKIIIQGDHES